ncbi:MAG: tRNA(Ile)-lysidine synthetase, partial [Chloroflexi bacterium]|nr:tRNA(Ile)-lysidine synthetase [Chloroflexota bacterium]
QKIPAGWRDHLPLLVSGGEIAWVCGWRVDQRFAVTAKTGEVWLARFSSGGNEQTAR